jgi:hypothetical protein
MTAGRPLKIIAWSVALVALLGVFALYTLPEFLFTLATQVWSCF